MIGTTGLQQLRVDCIVGVYPQERVTPQAVILDIELDYDFAPATTNDTITHAVDYALVASEVTTLIQTRKFHLIETLADETAAMLLARTPAVRAVRLTIRKPAAVPAAAASFVRIERTRP